MEEIKQQTLEKLPRRIDGDGDRWYTHEDVLMAIDLAVSKELENERQFILNVLDGVDEADRQMGNIEGGTLAIRHALKSRTICRKKNF